MSRVLTLEENIGTAAARHRGLRELFDELGLDYYCEGNLAVEEAAAAAGLDVRAVRSRMERISSADAGPNWLDEPLSALVEHLEMKGHGIARTLMFHAALLFAEIDLDDMRRMFRDLSSDVIVHMEHEEHTIFPAMVALEEAWIKGEEAPPRIEGGFRAAAARFVREHADIARRLRTLHRKRLECGAAGAQAVKLFRQLEELERCLHESFNLENYVAFPRAIALDDALAHAAPA